MRLTFRISYETIRADSSQYFPACHSFCIAVPRFYHTQKRKNLQSNYRLTEIYAKGCIGIGSIGKIPGPKAYVDIVVEAAEIVRRGIYIFWATKQLSLTPCQ